MHNESAPVVNSQLALDQLLDEAGIRRFNLMFITGRSGSTWLAESLGWSGEVGRGDELFNSDMGPELREEFGFDPWASSQTIREVLRARSPQGVFWAQVGAHSFAFLTRHLISERALASPRVHICRLDRRDRLAQALSFVKASSSGQWIVEAPGGGRADGVSVDLPLCPDQLRAQLATSLVELRHRVDVIASHLSNFAAAGRTGPEWFYEDLVTDPPRSHLAVAEFLRGGAISNPPKVRALGVQRTDSDLALLRRLTQTFPQLQRVHESHLGCAGVSFAVEALQDMSIPLDLSDLEQGHPLAPVRAPEDAPRVTWSTHGEDRTLWAILERDQALPEDGTTGVFVDVGAYHPFVASNSALFEAEGWKVIAVEPNPFMAELWMQRRPQSTVEQTAVGLEDGEGVLHFFGNWASSNTLVDDFARDVATSQGLEQPDELVVPIVPLRDLLRRNLPDDTRIQVLSVDVEGMDEDVLRSSDWDVFRPYLVCVEDIDLNLSRPEVSGVYSFLRSQDYELVCHVGLSSIYRDAVGRPTNSVYGAGANADGDEITKPYPHDSARQTRNV